MKSLKKVIISLMLIIIVLAVCLFIVKINNENLTANNTVVVEEEIDMSTAMKEGQIEMVEYNSINSAVTIYIQTLNRVDGQENVVNTVAYDEKKQNVINLLSENYIKKNSITIQNLEENLELLDRQLLFNVYRIKRVNNVNNVKSYVVDGIIETLEFDYISDICLIVNIDYNNTTFSVEPTNEKYEDINSLAQIQEVVKKDNNQYAINKVTIENTAKDYINRYKRMVLAKSELMYEKLDLQYREKRFGNVENFKDYIISNRQEIIGIRLEQYMVNNYEDYTEYVCRDQYKNLYIFKETAPMEFTVTLDTYTLPNEKFTTTYESSDSHMKVMMNIDKWIQMLNNRDYTSAYNVLDETFRQNNFGSVDEFEEYMRENLPLHYDVEFTDFSDQGQNYVQDIELTDITKENTEVVTKSIIMKLGEGTDFVMSFKIQ